MTPTKVTIVIVTYNGAKYMPGLLGSLAKMNRDGLEVTTLVVDNASTDETASLLADCPFVELHLSTLNLGFAGGNNLGIRMAMERGAEFVYLLNQDTEVEPDFLTAAVAATRADERVGSVQSLLLLSPETHLVNSTGNAIQFLGLAYCLDYRGSAEKARAAATHDVVYGSGAGLLLRCSALRTVGLLDEELFMYHEDTDLGLRLTLAGFRNVCTPKSVVFHKYEFSRSIRKFFWMERNRYVMFIKNLRFWTLCVLLPWMLIAEVPMLLMSFRTGWWKEKLRVYGWFWKGASWRYLLRERRTVQATRTVSDREAVKLWRSDVAYQEVAGPFMKYVANPLMALWWAVLRRVIV